MGNEADIFLTPPENPGEADTEVTWFDTGDGGYASMEGVIGDMLFDEDVTLFVRTAQPGGQLRTMNGNGAGEVIPADTPTPLKVIFTGYRTQIALETTATPPTIWHANARLTEGEP